MQMNIIVILILNCSTSNFKFMAGPGFINIIYKSKTCTIGLGAPSESDEGL